MTTSGVTPEECKIGRAALGMTDEELAEAAGIAAREVRALEDGAAHALETPGRIQAALAAGGVTFHTGRDGRARMRVRTLDGIIEAPVALLDRPARGA